MWLLWWIKLHDHRVKLLFLYHRERECHNFFILYSHLNYSSQMLRVKMRVTVRAISLLSLSLAQSFWRLCNLSSYFPSVSFLYLSFFMWRASFRSIHYIWEKILEECAAFPPLQMLLTLPYSKPSTFTPDSWLSVSTNKSSTIIYYFSHNKRNMAVN